LNTGADKKPAKQAITESRISEVTGDKSAKQEVEVFDNNNVIDLKRLAGL